MNIQSRKDAFIHLGSRLKDLPSDTFFRASNINPWFTPENIKFAISSVMSMLDRDSVEKFTEIYYDKLAMEDPGKRVGVVLAGNIPLVGFHDFLCVLLAGHTFIGKLSSDDPELLRIISRTLIDIEPAFSDRILFTEDQLSGFDAVIATGSNNTSRYFEYYFGKYPHIIRKNRNGLAVIKGNESKESLQALGEDIFMYFGMGCRNVSKLFVPENYDWKTFMEAIEEYANITDHNKYSNNYNYNKTILVLNQQQFIDTGFLLLKEDNRLSSPLSVLYFEHYSDIQEVNEYISNNRDEIQCIVSECPDIQNTIPPGKSQHPELWDYADDVDTMEFLLSLD